MKEHSRSIRVGVIGAGTMGRHHVRIASQSPRVIMTGLFDPDKERAAEHCRLNGCSSFESMDELIGESDALIIAAPTSMHLEIGSHCLNRGRHVMMEKPLAHNAEASEQLVQLAREKNLVLMAGHVERYNPTIQTLMKNLEQDPHDPVCISARRLASFDGTRCMDTDVLFDLLIHDIDLALEIADSPVSRIYASAKPVFTDEADMVHATIDFENNAVATLWAARCSPHRLRDLTVTTRGHYYCADTMAGSLTVSEAPQIPDMRQGVCVMGVGESQDVPVPDKEPLQEEADDFFTAIESGALPIVHGGRALAAMQALEMVAASVTAGKPIIP